MNKSPLPPLSEEAKSLVLGSLYEHYKGLRYRLIQVARHSETLEEYVVYQALYGDHGVWIRPLQMFLEEVVIDGKITPRFKPVE